MMCQCAVNNENVKGGYVQMKEVSFKKGDVIFREGEEGKFFYYIKK